MWLIVGLGNPGAKYQLTRHNIGFIAVEAFAQSLQAPALSQNEHKSLVSKFKLDGEDAILAMPQTFMNLSGDAVQSLVSFYKVPLDHLVVIHDDVDLPFGQIRLQKARGHGGQNGIRDIHQKLGSNEYLRIKMGIGRPANPHIDIATYVLQKFSEQELQELPGLLDRCGDGLEKLIDEGFAKASTLLNSL